LHWLESKETPVERSPGFFVDPGRLEMLKASHNDLGVTLPRRPQAECEARKIAPRRASIYT
ncbi:hypothetical protein ACLXBB_36170, partial [Pseudomonas aeruginosa]|uniref:hypothetical protein n=1 Tax=Pseudomonas aeruginosa TaxID=287 RepID=UPI001F2AF97C